MPDPSQNHTLNYGLSQPSIRFGRFALGAVFLVIYSSALLVWLNLRHDDLEFLRDHGMLEWTVRGLRLLAPLALIVGVWFLANVLPRLSPKPPRTRTVVLALASICSASMLFEVIPHNSGWLYEFWKAHPVPMSIFHDILDFTGAFALAFLCLAGIGFMANCARYARTQWIAIIAACLMVASALRQLLQILDAVGYRLEIPASISPLFKSIDQLPLAKLYKADLLLQLMLWMFLAIWATLGWRTVRVAGAATVA